MQKVNLDDLKDQIVIKLVTAPLDAIDDLRELEGDFDPGITALWSDQEQSIVAFVFDPFRWEEKDARGWVK